MNAWLVFAPPTVLFIFSFGVLAYMVWKYRMHTGIIDVDSIPEVKEDRKKEALLRRRIEDRGREAEEKRRQTFREWSEVFFSRVGTWAREVERKMQRYIRSEERRRRGATSLEHSIKTFLEEGEGMLQVGDVVGAEKKMLAVIRKDAKNIRAYRALAQVYVYKKEWEDAKATYEFIHTLSPEDEGVLMALADISDIAGETLAAVQYVEQAILINPHIADRFSRLCRLYGALGEPFPAFEAARQAVELDGGNAKYLDEYVECAILIGDKKVAEDAFQQLRRVDYQHPSLLSFRERIEAMANG
jgi:Tfp pilus assembly protein PilF